MAGESVLLLDVRLGPRPRAVALICVGHIVRHSELLAFCPGVLTESAFNLALAPFAVEHAFLWLAAFVPSLFAGHALEA